MPTSHAPTGTTRQELDWWYAPTGTTRVEIGHLYHSPDGTSYDILYEHGDLPTITTFTISPTSGTATSVSTITAAWTVAGETTAGRSYNYGATMTAATSPVHRTGWSARHNVGSIVYTPATAIRGHLSFVTYFASAGGTTVGADLNTRYFVRVDFTVADNTNGYVGDGSPQLVPTELQVDGVGYPLTPRDPSNPARGYTSAAGVPAFVDGQTYNINVKYSDDTWAWPETNRAATVAGTTTYPTVQVVQTLASGPVTTFASTAVPSGSVTITRPNEDATYRFEATNAEGSAHLARHFDFRSAPTGLALTLVSQTPDQHFADDTLVLRAAFTADPLVSATIEAPGFTTITGVTNGSEHRRVVPRNVGSVRNITFLLRVRGVSPSNQPYPAAGAEATATLAVSIPRRGAGG